MAGITWGRLALIEDSSSCLSLDESAPPVSPVGGTTPQAVPVTGLREADAIREAFATVGWDVRQGHDWALTTGFQCDGIPTSFGFSFDESGGSIRTWVSATVAVRRATGEPLSPAQLSFLAAVLTQAEDPFPSAPIPFTLGRTAGFAGVETGELPIPFAAIIADWNVLVADHGGMRYEQFDPPVESVVVGYHWSWIGDAEARTSVITNATDKLPSMLTGVRDLSRQDPVRFQHIWGDAVPSLELGDRLQELRSTTSPAASNTESGRRKTGQTPTRFCTNCGEPRVAEANFCGRCGTAFADQASDLGGTPVENESAQIATGNDEFPLSGSAREMTERLAVQGDSLAMYMLAFDAESRGDTEGARRWREMSANAGNSDAMAMIALREFQDGNTEAFVYWARQAADAGQLQAMAALGMHCVNQEDWFEARTWLEPAAAAGDSTAKLYLGMVERAVGDPIRATHLFEEAANDGESGAMYEMGAEAYAEGRNTEARTWWRKAASEGNSDAMWGLGMLAWQSDRLEDASHWFSQAAADGNVEAMWMQANVVGRMEGDAARRPWDERAASNGHPFAQNYLGSVLVQEGRLEEGLNLLEACARQGMPWGLASFSWALIKRGEYQRAIQLGSEVLSTCEDFAASVLNDPELAAITPEQLANAKSNHALCLLAVGGHPEASLALWESGADTGHLESRFYPAVLDSREGRSGRAAERVRLLNQENMDEIRSTLHELRSNGEPWLAAWCDEGLALLDGSMGAAPTCSNCRSQVPADVRFCPMCGQAI